MWQQFFIRIYLGQTTNYHILNLKIFKHFLLPACRQIDLLRTAYPHGLVGEPCLAGRQASSTWLFCYVS